MWSSMFFFTFSVLRRSELSWKEVGIGIVTKLELGIKTFNGECKCLSILVATCIWSEQESVKVMILGAEGERW